MLATYTYQNYSGDAYVLFWQNDRLYEVVGGHCSCNGLEGQWMPEETSFKAIKARMEKGTYFRECMTYDAQRHLEQLIKAVEENSVRKISGGDPD